MGLPQSMQNFDAGSFSRPQTAQRVVKGVGLGDSGEYMTAGGGAGEGAGQGWARCGAWPHRIDFGHVTRLRSLLLLLVALAGVVPARATAQVRPDLAWRTIATEHFRIHFTVDLELLARRTAFHAEQAWARLSTELAPPRGRVDIVVADNVDYANGYATPFPTNRIVIYARPPVEEPALRNHRDWNEILVTHELTHIFHLDRVRGAWALGQRLFGRAAPLFPNTYAPSWIIEGLAVHYETALTGGGRLAGTEFPAYVRAAALAADLPALDEITLAAPRFPGGQQAYLYGSFAVSRSDSAQMGRFVEASSGRLIPWRHDANARDAFGQTFSARWRVWRDSVLRAEQGLGAAMSDDAAVTTLTRHGFTARFPRFSGENELVYVANDSRRTTGLNHLDLDGRLRRLSRRNSVDVSTPVPGLRTVQGELDFTDPYSLRTDLFRGVGAGRRRITRNQRLSAPDAHVASGRIVAVQTEPGTTSLVLLEPADDWNAKSLVRGTLDLTWAEPRLSRGGDRVAAARWERGGRTAVVVLDLTGRELRRFAPRGNRISLVSSPVWEPGDSTLLFVSDHEGRAAIYRGDLRSGAYGRVWSTRTALNTPDVSPSGERIAAVELRGDGYHVVVRETPRDVALELPAADTLPDPLRPTVEAPLDTVARVRRYSALATLLPRWWLPLYATTGPGTPTIGLMSSGRDVIDRHAWNAELSLAPARDEITARLGYSFAGLGVPVLFADYLQEWDHAPIRDTNRALVGWLGIRSRQLAMNVVFERPRVRFSSYLVVGGEAEILDFRSYPGELLEQLNNPVLLGTIETQAVRLTAGVSTMQRPFNAVSQEDGVSIAATHRLRYDVGIANEDIGESIVAGTVAKSLPFAGFARHVIALRAAYGLTGHATTSAFDVGGVNGSSLEIVPGVVIGGSARTFAVRGFNAGAQLGVRAAAGSAEYRAPLSLIGRGVGMLPLFFQKASVTAFADAGRAWCEREVADSFICRAPLPANPWIASVGAELGLDASLQYDRAYRFRLGYARPVAGERFAPSAQTLYFSLGSSF